MSRLESQTQAPGEEADASPYRDAGAAPPSDQPSPSTRAEPPRPTLPPEARELGGKLAGLSLPRQVFTLAVWPFFELVGNALVGIVDTVIAGHLDNVAAANAIAVAAFVGWLLNMLNGALGVGSSAVVARAIGAKHGGLVNAAVGQAMLLAFAWGLVSGVVLFLLAEPIAVFCGLTGDAQHMATRYVQIVAMVGPVSAMLFTGNAVLRAAGDTRTPFIAMAVVNAINVGLSLMLVYAPAPWGGYGVAGIAGGTAGAWFLGGVGILLVLLSSKGPVKLWVHRLRPQPRTARRIVRVGIPALIESSGMWIGNAIILRIVGGLGHEAGPGAHIVAVRVESISFMPAFAIGTAAAVLTGQYLGLGDPDRARRAIRLSWGFAGVMMAGFGVLFMLIPESLARLLSKHPEVYELAGEVIFICGPAQFFFGTYLVLSQAFRGAGDTKTTMILTYASTFGIRLPAAWILGEIMGLGLTGVWFALCGELVVRGCLYMARYAHGGWAKVEV